ncbi:MAG: hypothetical protein ACOC1P_05790, partial [Minisyncoccales bacterium]
VLYLPLQYGYDNNYETTYDPKRGCYLVDNSIFNQNCSRESIERFNGEMRRLKRLQERADPFSRMPKGYERLERVV